MTSATEKRYDNIRKCLAMWADGGGVPPSVEMDDGTPAPVPRCLDWHWTLSWDAQVALRDAPELYARVAQRLAETNSAAETATA